MPVIRFNDQLLYFAHIPKCGGSSIEDYLANRFELIGFHDNDFSLTPLSRRWTRTSPQHVDWKSLQTLLPAEFFDAVFAVVRHPVSRIISVYHFQVEVEKTAASDVSFSDWLIDLARTFEADPFIIDGHFRPQVDFVPPNCQIFHLEHGLEPVIPYLDSIVGNADGPRFIGHRNQRANRKGASVRKVVPTHGDLERIKSLYAADFARFGYVLEQNTPIGTTSDIPQDILSVSLADRRLSKSALKRLASSVRRRLAP